MSIFAVKYNMPEPHFNSMERKVTEILQKWKESHNRALVLEGPRQIGKTYIMKEFAKLYPCSEYIDLEQDLPLRMIFEETGNADSIYEELSYRGIKFEFDKGKPLLILDEIQSCPSAYSALKTLAADGRCDILASGSLLGIQLSDTDRLSPMGYVQYVKMEPMDFEEFLWAMGIERNLTEKLRLTLNSAEEIGKSARSAITDYFRKFMTVGGMPAAVLKYADTRDYNEVREIHASIYRVIESDALKYSDRKDRLKILSCLESIPRQLSKENKSFVYKDIEKTAGAGKREYGSAIDWLYRAGLINICYNLKDICEPLPQMERPESFKIYMKDSGLLTYMLGIESASAIESGNTYVNRGAVMESCIAQALICNGYVIHFYSKQNSTLEMDFILNYKNKITALEIKSGKQKKSKSLTMMVSGQYNVGYGIKVSDAPVSIDELGILHLPLFGPCFFDPPVFENVPAPGSEEVNNLLNKI